MNVSYNQHRDPAKKAGFTLIELLVVVSIIVILAGITVAVVVNVGRSRDEKVTRSTLHTISVKLEEYANENNGLYPVGQDGTSTILYQALSGDYSGQGQIPSGPIYWPELNDQGNSSNSLVGRFRQNLAIFDGFGQPFRYRSAKDENGNPVPNIRNDGAYDLWSIGPDGLPSDINTPGNLFTEETQDDIWK